MLNLYLANDRTAKDSRRISWQKTDQNSLIIIGSYTTNGNRHITVFENAREQLCTLKIVQNLPKRSCLNWSCLNRSCQNWSFQNWSSKKVLPKKLSRKLSWENYPKNCLQNCSVNFLEHCPENCPKNCQPSHFNDFKM